MSGGGSGGNTNYPAPVVSGLWNQTNQDFQPLPYPNLQGSANQAQQTASSLNVPGSQQAGAALAGWTPQLITQANQNFTNAQPWYQQANQAYQQGGNPQGALYNQLYSQNMAQTNVNDAQNNVAGTPYGAGLANQSSNNFDMNWQNQQLARQGQAAQTAQSLAGIGANQANTGLGQGSLAGQVAGQGTATGLAVPQQTIQDLLAYLGLNTANSAAQSQSTLGAMNAGTSLYGAQNQAQNQQAQIQASGLGGLGSLIGGSGGLSSLGGGLGDLVSLAGWSGI